MYDSALLMFNFWKWWYNNPTLSCVNSLPLIDVFIACWNLSKAVSKSLTMTSFVSLPIEISTGSLFEDTVRVSSKFLTEIQLFSITSWTLHSPRSASLSLFNFAVDLWSFSKSLKYGLIIPRYSSRDKFSYLSPPTLIFYVIIISSCKTTISSYWFVIVSFKLYK